MPKPGSRRKRNTINSQAVTDQTGAAETIKRVCCAVCSTDVGVIDEDEIYHFLNVIPSEAWLLPFEFLLRFYCTIRWNRAVLKYTENYLLPYLNEQKKIIWNFANWLATHIHSIIKHEYNRKLASQNNKTHFNSLCSYQTIYYMLLKQNQM